MRPVLLDTHLLLWAKLTPARLPIAVQHLLAEPEIQPIFSVASIWEIAIKQSQGRADFTADAAVVREKLLETGYSELTVVGEHASAVATLPLVHRDPFDRMLVAQAIVERMELLTVDAVLAAYPGPIRVF